MKLPANLTAENLLLNESFLNYYFRKNDADVWEWEEHLEHNPQHQPLVDEAIRMIDRLALRWTEAQIRQRFTALQETLNTNQPTDDTPVIPLTGQAGWMGSRWAIGVAASVLLLMGVWAVFQYRTSTISPIYRQQVAHQQFIERVNSTEKPQLVMLPDGSSILLQKNSRLSFPRQFTGDSRAVYLDGEAFFEIQKDSRRPFYVYADALVARVLGTSFTVNARPGNPAIRVVVRTGKVSVYRYDTKQKQPADEGLVVTPNQQISLNRESPEFSRSLVAEPQLLKQTHGFSFTYRDTPAATVFAQIQQAYGLTVVYDEAQLKNCPVTASLLDEPLYEKLDLVCRAIEARYEVIDGQIVITGGCSN